MTASTPAHGDLQTGPRDGAHGDSDLPTDAADVPAGPSDAELLAAARIGDAEAYAELFRRHSPAARALARHLARHDSDADDLVSEAFTKVLNALRNGNGPTVALRPYLLTAVRRVHVDRAVAVQRVQPVEDVAVFDPGEPFVDPALAGLERTLVARAYGQLPERWQTVLWHTEVEGMSPREVAPLLGMSPNAVSALALRARSGLRDAYLAAHIPDPRRRECESTLPRLAAYVRGSASDRETAQIEAHVDTCDDCRAVLAELRDVGVGMRSVIAPLVLGLAAPAYMAKIAALGGAAAAGAGVAGSSSTTSGTSAASTAATGTSAAGTSAAGASATTAAGGGAGAVGAGAGAMGAGSGGLAGLVGAGTAGGWLLAGAAVVTLGVAAFAVHALVTGEDDGRPAAAAAADSSGGAGSDSPGDAAGLDADARGDDGDALAEPGTAAALPGDGGQLVLDVPGEAVPFGDPFRGTAAGTGISGDTASSGTAPGGAASAGATGPGTSASGGTPPGSGPVTAPGAGAGPGTAPGAGAGPGTAPGTGAVPGTAPGTGAGPGPAPGPGTGAPPGSGTTTPPPAEPPPPDAPAPSTLSLASTTLPSGQESALDVRISGPAQATTGVLRVTVPDRIRLVATGCTVDGQTATCDLGALDGSDAFSVVVRANEPGSYDVALELRATNAGGTTTSRAVATVSVRPGGHVTS